MPLYLTEDQAMLRDTARSFMAEEGAIPKQLRHWRDTGCTDGFGTALWKQFAELGFTVPRNPYGTFIADVTDLGEDPESLALIGPHQGIDQLAEAAGTIGYEVLTSLGPRYARTHAA